MLNEQELSLLEVFQDRFYFVGVLDAPAGYVTSELARDLAYPTYPLHTYVEK